MWSRGCKKSSPSCRPTRKWLEAAAGLLAAVDVRFVRTGSTAAAIQAARQVLAETRRRNGTTGLRWALPGCGEVEDVSDHHATIFVDEPFALRRADQSGHAE